MPRRRITLADVGSPPDTSVLLECDPRETAAAIESLAARWHRRRAQLCVSPQRAAIDRCASALHRLASPHIAAYRCRDSDDIIVSEPFNREPCAVQAAALPAAIAAVRSMFGGTAPRSLARALAPFGERALRAAVEAGVRITIVPTGSPFAAHSSAIARLVPGIDSWPAPPSGLFVVEDRLVMLRHPAMAMTAAHEFAHALDAVLAERPRSYLSFESAQIRRCFGAAPGFVNEYAASGLDEYFAESMRAYLEVNDARCAWLPLTRRTLRERDAAMYDFLHGLFSTRLR